MIFVTSHAISRAIERGAASSYADAERILSTAFIRKAIEFGAREIILGTGHHAVVVDGVIVTVRPKPFTKPKRRATRPDSPRTGFDQEAAA